MPAAAPVEIPPVLDAAVLDAAAAVLVILLAPAELVLVGLLTEAPEADDACLQ